MHRTSQLSISSSMPTFSPGVAKRFQLVAQEVGSAGCNFLEQCDEGAKYAISAKKLIRSDCHTQGGQE